MAELELIERSLAKGHVREYALRRCSKLILEELCHKRNLLILPTGKRPSNRAVKNDYIRALLEVRASDLLVYSILYLSGNCSIRGERVPPRRYITLV